MIDRKIFFDRVRAEPFSGFLSGSQVTGLSTILDEAERRGVGDQRHLAYRLATVFHETGKAMIPVREAGGEAYLKAKPYYPWVGMGLVEVTWETNARKFGATKPEDLMGWPVALRALFDGMDEGVFTGQRLSAYFGDITDDPVGARRIINGTDKAELIAGYHRSFLSALNAAAPMPAPVPPAAVPVTDDVKALQARLAGLGLYSGAVDGDFGAATETAVRAFQAGHALAVDGEVGPATAAALAVAKSGAVAQADLPRPPLIPPAVAGPHLLPVAVKSGFWAGLVAAFTPKPKTEV